MFTLRRNPFSFHGFRCALAIGPVHRTPVALLHCLCGFGVGRPAPAIEPASLAVGPASATATAGPPTPGKLCAIRRRTLPRLFACRLLRLDLPELRRRGGGDISQPVIGGLRRVGRQELAVAIGTASTTASAPPTSALRLALFASRVAGTLREIASFGLALLLNLLILR